MAHVSGERAPAFIMEKLEKLVDGVLPQYTLLYGPPDKQVSAHQKKDIWRAIAKEVRTLGVYHRRSTHCRKRWEDIRRWSKKTAEAQLGMASQCGRGARRTMAPLMFMILAVAYSELDGRLRASQQQQGASSDGGAVAPEQEGAASHMALEGDTTESEFTSGMEGEGSSTAGTGADTSDTDSSSDGSSLAVAGPSVQYSPWSSPLAFVLLVEEQEDKGWKNLKFRFHGVLVPRGMCRDRDPLHRQSETYPGVTTTRETPNVFPGGTDGRILTGDARDFWGRDLKRLTLPEEGVEENTERGEGGELSILQSEEETPTTPSRGEDAGPGFQDLRKCPSQTEQGEEAPESKSKPEKFQEP
ncbi:hypothetical protein NDU88_004194 [Pleurodeles waltl]|uniref:Myb/SANT-like DNA-binding domain-containing protein n=1 Tax=Pleurodeles waltl TaxID=8319 RepID=A0AAV7M5M4_PLEWA|nr:hypothetical protein NDU88_004194 [Pleurodeles waltl]